MGEWNSWGVEVKHLRNSRDSEAVQIPSALQRSKVSSWGIRRCLEEDMLQYQVLMTNGPSKLTYTCAILRYSPSTKARKWRQISRSPNKNHHSFRRNVSGCPSFFLEPFLSSFSFLVLPGSWLPSMKSQPWMLPEWVGHFKGNSKGLPKSPKRHQAFHKIPQQVWDTYGKLRGGPWRNPWSRLGAFFHGLWKRISLTYTPVWNKG